MSPGETVAVVLLCWTVVGFALALLIARGIPASPEPDEHQSSDLDAEFDWRVAAQVRAINDFHKSGDTHVG